MGKRKRKWRIRWYECLGILALGITYAVIQFYRKSPAFETREEVITEIVIRVAQIVVIWVLFTSYLWFLKFMHEKTSRRKPPERPPHIPPTWEPITASMNRVHLFGSLALLIIAGIAYGLFWWIWGNDAIRFQFAQFMLFFIAGIILHELFHAIGWITTGHVSIRDVKFGIMWRYLAPYAHCKVPIPVWVHRFGTVLPGIVTGIIPTLVGLILGHFTLTLVGALLIGGAAGDLAILNLTRGLDRDQRLMDHPSDVGFFIVTDDAPNAPLSE